MNPSGQQNRSLPRLAWVEQDLGSESIQDIGRAVREQVRSLKLEEKVSAGQSVAVTAGSRGIRNLERILGHVIIELRRIGLEPFIVPSMGSHGGATAEGQRAVLSSMGITEEAMQAPIRSGMETIQLGETDQGIPVQIDALAMQADHIAVVNRIKAHTKFKSRFESGLMKMLAIGLGNHAGASLMHRLAVRHSMPTVILEAARLVLAQASVLFGLGIVENGLGETFRLQAIPPEGFEAEEPGLLDLAKDLSPKIPCDRIDLLIVDRIGKDISGTGMDTNVIGRNRDILGDFTTSPRVKRILVRDLTPGTKGNALGIGFADFCTDRVVRAADLQVTYTNAMTGLSPEKAAIPMHFLTDREALLAALESLGDWDPDTVRVVRIEDTLQLRLIQVSTALINELPASCTCVGPPETIRFQDDGNLAAVQFRKYS